MHGLRKARSRHGLLLTVLVAAVALLAAASSTTALATSGYRIWGTAWHRPPVGSSFTVLSHGIAAQKAHLYIYLDRQPCRWTWASEANRFPSFKAGQSSFKDSGRGVVSAWVSGHFSHAFTARAGSAAEPEYACSYLTIPNSQGRYRITAAHRSNAYFVTN